MTIKSWLRESNLTKDLYQRLYDIKWNREEKQRRKNLQKNGGKILHQLLDALGDTDLQVFAMYGTLLGLIRSRKLITHDFDIDLGLLASDPDLGSLAKWFNDRNFTLSRGFVLDGQLVEFSVNLHNLNIDFFAFCDSKYGYGTFTFFKDDSCPPEAEIVRAARMRFTPIEGIEYLESLGIRIPIPQNAERVLRESYGDDWAIPNPDWRNEDTPVRYELANVYARKLEQPQLLDYLEATK